MASDRNKRKKSRHTIFWLVFIELLVISIGLLLLFVLHVDNHHKNQETEEPMSIAYEEIEKKDKSQKQYVAEPDIDEQLLTINEWSRPGKKIKSLDYIVIHYLGNPETTAQQNHDYFESLKDLQDTSMSANYVVGMEGEIIHCVPDDEVAYASNKMNSYSISIENCHPDETGKFTDDTYASLVHLVAYLSEKYGLDREHIIRHYDVTGKDCPKYFVEHEDAWEKFLDDVMYYRSECQRMVEEMEAERNAGQTEGVDELTAFMENNAELDVK